MTTKTAPDLSTQELADKLHVSPQMINEYRRRIEKRTGKPIGSKRGKTNYYSEEDQLKIEAEKAIGRDATPPSDFKTQAHTTQAQESHDRSNNRIQDNLTRKIDGLSTEFAVQAEVALMVGTLRKIGNVEDPRLDQAYAAFDAAFDAAIDGAGDIVGNVLAGVDSNLPLLDSPAPLSQLMQSSEPFPKKLAAA